MSAKRKKAFLLAGIFGGAGVAITVVAFPFALPALRRYCLPYLPATDCQLRRVVEILKGSRGTLVDLGSGDGRVVVAAAKLGFRSVGYELNPWLVLASRVNAVFSGVWRRTEFHQKDLWKVDLGRFDNIVFFGVDEMMPLLGEKIYREAKPNARIISCRFMFPGWIPLEEYDDGADGVWVYNMQSIHRERT